MVFTLLNENFMASIGIQQTADHIDRYSIISSHVHHRFQNYVEFAWYKVAKNCQPEH